MEGWLPQFGATSTVSMGFTLYLHPHTLYKDLIMIQSQREPKRIPETYYDFKIMKIILIFKLSIVIVFT